MFSDGQSLQDLGKAAFLNRVVYGGANASPDAFRAATGAVGDPAPAGDRTALNVYDRYDAYLNGFGFTVLSSAELGFADAGASDVTDGLDRNFTYSGGLWRNNFQDAGAGVPVPFTDAGAVALTAVTTQDGEQVLHLVFRGTDADLGADGEAGTAAGQARYYRQLKPLIDQVHDYAADEANGVDRVVVSGQSLGGQMADIFAAYDGARFAALEGVDLQVVSLASAGIEPALFALLPGFDPTLVTLGADDARLTAPEWYLQYAHSEDIVYFPERYRADLHAQTDPEQAPITLFATTLLRDHVHFDGNLIEVAAPRVPQYALSPDFDTNFLAQHYPDFYALTGQEIARAAQGVDIGDFDAVIALFGIDPDLRAVSGRNNVNGWGLPVDDRADFAVDPALGGADLFVIGLSGRDRIATGAGDDLIAGGRGDDGLRGRSGDDVLKGDAGRDVLSDGGGDDWLQGGVGADRFEILGARRGTDVVADFAPGRDVVDLSRNAAFGRWEQVRDNAEDVAGGVEITRAGETIRFLELASADLDRSDFLF